MSTFANLIRGGLTFFTTLFVARVLGPEHYGNYAFLLGSFTAVRALLEMGTASAFYTFISKRPRAFAFYISYAIWQLIQFTLPFLVIAFIFPQTWLDAIWVGQEKDLILLAFSAIFLQQMIWPTLSQIGESNRLTQRVQTFNICISAGNLFLAVGAWALEMLTVSLLFWILLFQYLAVLIPAFKVFSVFKTEKEPLDIRAMLGEYLAYCLPLILVSWLGFAYEFTDRWLLQYFGGSEEQAFFMVGYRFAAIGLLTTTSMLNIFWKEIAEAQETQNLARLQTLYRRVSRFLYTISAIICGFLVPWSEAIASLILGSSYTAAASVIAVMFVFSAHASLGQVNGTFILASGKTKAHLVQGSIFMAISIPISYLVQAPHSAFIPGFHLGSLGMAWKALILNVAQVNFIAWWIAKQNGWKFDWAYQVVSLAGSLGLGWLSYELAMGINSMLALNIYLQTSIALVIYVVMIVAFIWLLPWLIGFSRNDIKNMTSKLIHSLKAKGQNL